MRKRVVITGMGVVSAVGTGVEAFWNGLKSGKNGVSLVESFDVSEYPTKVAAEVKDFDPALYIDKKEAKRMDRYTQLAMAAAKQAVENSGLNMEQENKYRVGVIVGSGIGGMQTFEDQHSVLEAKGPGRVSPFFVPMMIANMASGRIAIQYGARGFNEAVVTACATGTNSIGDAFKVIQRGDADVMICGGAEAAVTPMAFAGFCSAKAMSTNPDPETACRPYDKDHDGFVMGEGAGVLVIEELEHARARGVEILAEIIGYGCTCDAYHITAPEPNGEGGTECFLAAIRDAGLRPEDIDYVNTHGTSTPVGDPLEIMVIKNAMGEHAKKVAVSSTKSMTGHLLGAAGAVEAIACVQTIREGVIAPTIHINELMEGCDLDVVPNVARKADVRIALSNSLGFGGHNAAIVIKRFEA